MPRRPPERRLRPGSEPEPPGRDAAGAPEPQRRAGGPLPHLLHLRHLLEGLRGPVAGALQRRERRALRREGLRGLAPPEQPARLAHQAGRLLEAGTDLGREKRQRGAQGGDLGGEARGRLPQPLLLARERLDAAPLLGREHVGLRGRRGRAAVARHLAQRLLEARPDLPFERLGALEQRPLAVGEALHPGERAPA